MNRRKVTIKDLASHCGVSIATISRVINNNGRFSEETRQIVLKAIKELEYIPNTSAKTLRMNTSRLVGIFVNTLNYEITADTVVRLQQELFEHGFVSIVCNLGISSRSEEEYYQMLQSMNVCCIITIASKLVEIPSNIPVICMFCNPNQVIPEADFIAETDEYATGYLAACELIQIGCKKLATVHVKGRESRISFGREIGYYHAIYENKLIYNENLSITIEEPEYKNYPAVLKRITSALKSNEAADGYFCVTDLLALATIRGLEMHHYSVPDQVKVIGCNDTSFAMLNNKPLTSIRHNVDEICISVVKSLERILNGETLPDEQRRQVFGVELIRRETT